MLVFMNIQEQAWYFWCLKNLISSRVEEKKTDLFGEVLKLVENLKMFCSDASKNKFVTKPFRKWNKKREKVKEHEHSAHHQKAME